MTTRWWAGAETESGIKVVHVQCDGDVGAESLANLVAEHGIDKTVSTLLKTSHPWVGLNWTPEPYHQGLYEPPRYEIIPGFGVKFGVDEPAHIPYHSTDKPIYWDIEYVAIIMADGKTIKWCHKGVTKGRRQWRTQKWEEMALP